MIMNSIQAMSLSVKKDLVVVKIGLTSFALQDTDDPQVYSTWLKRNTSFGRR